VEKGKMTKQTQKQELKEKAMMEKEKKRMMERGQEQENGLTRPQWVTKHVNHLPVMKRQGNY
jgi:hypothetical protein